MCRKRWVWALTLILKQKPDQQEIHNQAKHNETWVSWKILHRNNIHSLVIFTDNLCSAQLGLSMWRCVFLFLPMQPRNSWAQESSWFGLQAGGTTGAQCYHVQCVGQVNSLNYQDRFKQLGSSEFLGLTYAQLCADLTLWHWELNPEPVYMGIYSYHWAAFIPQTSLKRLTLLVCVGVNVPHVYGAEEDTSFLGAGVTASADLGTGNWP